MTLQAAVQVSVNGGAYTSGSVTAQAGQTLNYRQNPAYGTGITQQVWEVFDAPPDLLADMPGGWTLVNGLYTYCGATPPTITLPAMSPTAWGPIGMRQRLNGNPELYDEFGPIDPDYVSLLTDESCMVDVLSPNLAMRGICAGETNQYDVLREWVGSVMQCLRQLDAAAGSSSLSRVSGAGPVIAITPSTRSVLLTGATLTDLTGGVAGQQITVTLQTNGAQVTRGGSNGSKFALSGSAIVTAAAAFATLDVVYEPLALGGTGAWVERSRSTDNG